MSVMPGPVLRVDDHADVPARSYRSLSPAVTAAVVAGLAIVTVLAWIITVRKADSMSSMVMGLGHIGRAMRMDMSAWSFFGMWAVMMVAMMAPTIAPLVLAQLAVSGRKERGVGSTGAVVAGYFSLWCLLGLLYFVAFLWFHDVSPSAGGSRWLPALSGGIFLSLGATSSPPGRLTA